MLPRVLETEVMDGPDEVRDYDAMDHGATTARFVADFLAHHGPGRGGEVLDVGTGPARVPIAICRADRKLRILGVDLAGPMLDLARRNVADAELNDRIRFARGDAKNLPFPDGRFEAVISNTIIHHIPDPAPAPRRDRSTGVTGREPDGPRPFPSPGRVRDGSPRQSTRQP